MGESGEKVNSEQREERAKEVSSKGAHAKSERCQCYNINSI